MIASKSFYKYASDIIRLLLDYNADVNAKSTDGRNTALSLALYNKRIDSAKLLFDRGAIPQERDLLCAIRLGLIDIVQALLDCKLNVNIRDFFYKRTALMLAALFGFPNIVLLLLDYDANIRLKDIHDKTARDYALENGCKGIVEMLDCYEGAYKFFLEERKRSTMLLVKKDNVLIIKESKAGLRSYNPTHLPNELYHSVSQFDNKFKFSDFYNNEDLVLWTEKYKKYKENARKQLIEAHFAIQ